jgi:hypothetical protein
MEESTNTGMIENRRRIADELLASTSFKDSLRLFLKNIDPEAGPGLVRTLLGKDVEVPMAVLSTLPAIANCLIKVSIELVVQVRSKYPPPLLAGMTQSLLHDVDSETLAGLIKEIRELAKDLAPAFSAFSQSVEVRTSTEKERT